MPKIESQVEDLKNILESGSVVDQLFTLEELSNRLSEYPSRDIEYFHKNFLRQLLVFYSKESTPNELVLIIATLLKNIASHIKDERERQVIFIKTSGLMPRFLKNYKQTKLMADVMIAYQRVNQETKIVK